MPALPFELERLIFELAIQDSNHDDKVRISLVAKRVYEWIRPIIYRVAIARVSQDHVVSIQDWRNVRLADVAHFARHLLIVSRSQAQVFELLSTFRNVEDLAIWQGTPINPSLLGRINGLPLRMLSADLSMIDLYETITQGLHVFGNLTHLELLDLRATDRVDCKALKILPKLTHLCFYFASYLETQVIHDLLMHCPALRALIYAFDSIMDDLEVPASIIESDDTRFLILEDDVSLRKSIMEWERSTNGQLGLWELADKIVEARTNKFFEDNSLFTFSRSDWTYYLNDDGMRWLEAWSDGGRVEFQFHL